ncbi:MAG: YihY/virulence factor BrkB family protein [Aureispira sp.]|nr:YihY/virulence factor BrkB family protein [Aureispira sp.]
MFKLFKKIYSRFILPVFTVIRSTIQNYQRDKVLRLGAALAYYTIFSLPALIVVIIGLVGFFLGEAAVRGEIYSSLVEVVGSAAANQIQNAVKNIGSTDTNWWAAVIGVGLLIFVATGVFYVMQEALNKVFQVEEVPRKLKFKFKVLEIVINRVLSLGMVLSVGGLLVFSILSNAILLEVSAYVTENEAYVISKIPTTLDFLIPYVSYLTGYFLVFLNLGLSIFLIALFFFMLYNILPAVKLKWRYLWAGAFFAGTLFWIGEMLMGFYLSNTSVISAYGAAGSLIVLLIWVYYSAQLVFLGAEFIKALCTYKGVEIMPKEFAVRLEKAGVKKPKRKKRKSRTMDAWEPVMVVLPEETEPQRRLIRRDDESETAIEKELENRKDEEPPMLNIDTTDA